MAKSVLRLSGTSAGVKVYDGTETISLATDLIDSREVVSGTPTVDIYAMIYSNAFTITRNGVVIFKSTGTDPGRIEFSQFEMKDTVENTSDIVVDVAVGSQVYLLLRKTAGYKNKFEPEQFSVYDNPAAQGS